MRGRSTRVGVPAALAVNSAAFGLTAGSDCNRLSSLPFRKGEGERDALCKQHGLGTALTMTEKEFARLFSQFGHKPYWSDALNERELELFSFMAHGFWPQQICEEMAINRREFSKLQKAIRKKLGYGEIEFLQLVAHYFNGPLSLGPRKFGGKALPDDTRMPGTGDSP